MCERELRARNVGVSSALKGRLGALRSLLTEGRVLRVAAIGRRGAGKSSLANALAGESVLKTGDVRDQTREPAAVRFETRGLRVEWIDTPGMRAAAEPSRVTLVADALSAALPDVVVFLCQASEVDAGIDDDLADVARVLKAVRKDTGVSPALFGVVTKVDELAPSDVITDLFKDIEKRENIRRAVTVLHRHMLSRGVVPWGVVPVATYVEREGARVVHDGRWNLDALASRLAAASGARVIHTPSRLRAELDVMRAGLSEALIEAFAARAFALASGPRSAGQRREIHALETCLTSLLGALWGHGFNASLGGASAPARGLARLLDAARAGVAGVGAWRAGGALAAGRMRVLGENVWSALREPVSEEIARAMLVR